MPGKYKIEISRGEYEGTLTFEHGDVFVSAPCWWAAGNRIDAGYYRGAPTTLAVKQKSGIYLVNPTKGPPFDGNLSSNNGTRTAREIFIHPGENAGWSEGCIVLQKAYFDKMFSAMDYNVYNVQIRIDDLGTVLGPPDSNSQESQYGALYGI